MKWFERARLEWIAESIHIVGFIQRDHLRRKFGISRIQATKDLRKFRQLHPEAITYNTSSKRYEENHHAD